MPETLHMGAVERGGFRFVKCALRAVPMTSTSMKAKLIRIEFERGEAGLHYATSPDLKGLLVAEPSLEAAREAVPSAIAELYEACGVSVVVSEVDDSSYLPQESWVAVPRISRDEPKRVASL